MAFHVNSVTIFLHTLLNSYLAVRVIVLNNEVIACLAFLAVNTITSQGAGRCYESKKPQKTQSSHCPCRNWQLAAAQVTALDSHRLALVSSRYSHFPSRFFPLWLLPVGFFPLRLLPAMATSRCSHFPLRLLPVMVTSRYGFLPLTASRNGCFPL